MEKTNGLGVPLKHCQTINHFKEEIHLVLHCISVFIMVAYKK